VRVSTSIQLCQTSFAHFMKRAVLIPECRLCWLGTIVTTTPMEIKHASSLSCVSIGLSTYTTPKSRWPWADLLLEGPWSLLEGLLPWTGGSTLPCMGGPLICMQILFFPQALFFVFSALEGWFDWRLLKGCLTPMVIETWVYLQISL